MLRFLLLCSVVFSAHSTFAQSQENGLLLERNDSIAGNVVDSIDNSVVHTVPVELPENPGDSINLIIEKDLNSINRQFGETYDSVQLASPVATDSAQLASPVVADSVQLASPVVADSVQLVSPVATDSMQQSSDTAVVSTQISSGKSTGINKSSSTKSLTKNGQSKKMSSSSTKTSPQEVVEPKPVQQEVTADSVRSADVNVPDSVKQVAQCVSPATCLVEEAVNSNSNAIMKQNEEIRTYLMVILVLLSLLLLGIVYAVWKLWKWSSYIRAIRESDIQELSTKTDVLVDECRNLKDFLQILKGDEASGLSALFSELDIRISDIRNSIEEADMKNNANFNALQGKYDEALSAITVCIEQYGRSLDELSSSLSRIATVKEESEEKPAVSKVAYDAAVDRWINLNNKLTAQGKIRRNIQNIYALLAGRDVSDEDVQSDLSGLDENKKEEVSAIVSDIRLFRQRYMETIEGWLANEPGCGDRLCDVVRFPYNGTFDNELDEDVVGDPIADGEEIAWVASLGYMFPGSHNGCYRVKAKVCV